MSIHKQQTTYLITKVIQATGYVRTTFHPIAGLCPTYIISAERPPQASYPLRITTQDHSQQWVHTLRLSQCTIVFINPIER